MKNLFTLIFIGLFFLSCSTNEDEWNVCSLFDPAFPSLFVRIVDNTGANLIENGTIDPNNISVEGDFQGAGFQFIPENEFANPDAEIREFDNSLNLFTPNQSTFQYTINLNNFGSIDVDFKAEFTEIPCDLSYFNPVEANYDGEKLELREISSLQYLVVIDL